MDRIRASAVLVCMDLDRQKAVEWPQDSRERIEALLADVRADYVPEDAAAAASPPSCDPDAAVADFQDFAEARCAWILATPAEDLVHW